MTKLAVDGDILVYSAGFAAQKNIHSVYLGEKLVGEYEYKKEMMDALGDMDAPFCFSTRVEAEPVENALHSVKLMMEQTLDECKASKYKVYLTGPGNYRASVYPEYKANRDTTHKPVHYSSIKSYLINHWNGVIVEGYEADDAIGIAGYQHEAIMASIDKDLLMIPGTHYHLRSNNFVTIEEEEGNYIFLRQWLTGDSTDNIPGIKGMGPKKALKTIPNGLSFSEAYELIHSLYPNQKECELNATLVWILREKIEKPNVETVMNQIRSHLCL